MLFVDIYPQKVPEAWSLTGYQAKAFKECQELAIYMHETQSPFRISRHFRFHVVSLVSRAAQCTGMFFLSCAPFTGEALYVQKVLASSSSPSEIIDTDFLGLSYYWFLGFMSARLLNRSQVCSSACSSHSFEHCLWQALSKPVHFFY